MWRVSDHGGNQEVLSADRLTNQLVNQLLRSMMVFVQRHMAPVLRPYAAVLVAGYPLRSNIRMSGGGLMNFRPLLHTKCVVT